MAIKVMMTPEVIERVARALQTRQKLREIIRRFVKTDFDRHYLVMAFHKGLSEGLLLQMGFEDLAKLLSCPMSAIHAHLARHLVGERQKGRCELCDRASKDLKAQVQSLLAGPNSRQRD